MLVGIVRNRLSANPNKPIEKRHKIYLLDMLSRFNNIESFIFFEDGVNPLTKTIKGLFFNFETSTYDERETPYPDVIDTDCTVRWNSTEVFKSLFNECAFIYTRRLTKIRIDSIIQNSSCAQYGIDTHNYSRNQMDELLLKYGGTAIVKPSEGSEGRDVYKMKFNVPKSAHELGLKHFINVKSVIGKKYIVEIDKQKHKISNKEFTKTLSNQFEEQDFIIQEFVDSTTLDGNPFDIRLEIRRGEEGKWKFVRSYVKVGQSGNIVSNVAAGGVVTLNTQNFLDAQFGEEGTLLYKELKNIAKKLPPIIQKASKQFIPTITIDTGIDRSKKNKIKIFEVNTGASTTKIFSVMYESKLRINCYKYLFKNKSNILERQTRFVIDENDNFIFRVGTTEDSSQDMESIDN